MKIKTFAATGPETEIALQQIEAAVTGSGLKPDLAVIVYDTTHDDVLIHGRLRKLMPRARLMGGTSFNGFMTEAGISPAGSIGLFVVEDPDGSYGVAAAPRGADARERRRARTPRPGARPLARAARASPRG